MKKRDRRFRSTLPAPYLRVVLELGAQWGLKEADMLAGTALSAALLQQPDARIGGPACLRLVQNVMTLSGRADLGFAYGLFLKPTAHGFLGYAAMGSATLREAAVLISKYMRVRLSDISLQPSMEGSTVVILTRDNHRLGPLRHTIYEALFTVLYRHGCFLAGVEREDSVELCFDWPEPPYYAQYRGRLPSVRWNQPGNQIRFPLALLDKAVLTADSSAVKQALQALERELAELGDAPVNVAAQVRAELKRGTDGYPALETVASRLHMSASTLKRRLQAGGTHFQQLLDQTRREDALRLLQNPALDLQEITRLLGFSDPACFTRAFRRWTGKTPSAWREGAAEQG